MLRLQFLLSLIVCFVDHMKKSGRIVSIINDQYLLLLITVKGNRGNISNRSSHEGKCL
jgi:hypothetical protein